MKCFVCKIVLDCVIANSVNARMFGGSGCFLSLAHAAFHTLEYTFLHFCKHVNVAMARIGTE